MRAAIILSGCGVRDGSEIHESAFLMLALKRAGWDYACFAPDKTQFSTINHLDGSSGEGRNILVESARIARGNIEDLALFDPTAFDAVALPGGFGAATNLCDFALKGARCEVLPLVRQKLEEVARRSLPQLYLCIAPVIAACLFGKNGVKVTIGKDTATADAVSQTGARHVECNVDGVCVDETLKIVSVPAYMLATDVAQCYDSVAAGVQALTRLVSQN